MPKYRVTATMDVGYDAIIEAKDEEMAWAIARGDVAPHQTYGPKVNIEWQQCDDGHDWTLEDIYEVTDEQS